MKGALSIAGPYFDGGPTRKWGDYSTDGSLSLHNEAEGLVGSSDIGDEVIEVEPLLMLPPSPSSLWVLKVSEVRRRLSVSFKGMEQSVEDFFLESGKT